MCSVYVQFKKKKKKKNRYFYKHSQLACLDELVTFRESRTMLYIWALAFIYTIFLCISMYIYTYNDNEFGLYIDIILYLCIYIITYILILYIAIFCHAASLKKNIWPCGDSNLRRRYQSTDILCSRVKTIIMRKLRYSSIDYIYIIYCYLLFHYCICNFSYMYCLMNSIQRIRLFVYTLL